MKAKVIIPIGVILACVGWLVSANLQNANYFVTVDELPAMGEKAYRVGLRVKGQIVPGTILAKQKPVAFTIHENEAELKVLYIGEEPLPDLFQDRAEAVVEGNLRADGIFEAKHVQAKCASKYEAEGPGEAMSPYKSQESPQTEAVPKT